MGEIGIKDRLEPFFNRLPAVKRPVGHVHLKNKLLWTLGILILYLALSNVPLFGLHPDSRDLFEMYRTIMAGESGSLILLGIGPIVTASIILQLFVGADIIKLDLSDPRDQAIFQGMQKTLVFVMIALTTLPQIMAGYLMPDLELASRLGVSPTVITTMIFIQVCIGGILILFMDETVSKWGIGSGVGLFIVAGVAGALIRGVFHWAPDPFVIHPFTGGMLPVGLIPRWYEIFTTMGFEWVLTGNGLIFLMMGGGLLALIGTISIFAIVVYAESTRIEIPLAHSAVRGARGKFPVKLIYASVLPIILIMALVANIQMVGMLLWNSDLSIVGHNPLIGAYDGNTATFGIMYYISSIHSPTELIPSVAMHSPWQIALRIVVYLIIMILGSIVFALFWIDTAGMDPRSVAEQIQRSGMQIPGFRQNTASIERVMNRYIPKVTIIGGAFIGALAALASFTGTVGQAGGTGLLLTVSIVYGMYEQLASEQLMEMHPMLRGFFGEK
ncbi:MAG: preprotein translocase subunit SecY [Methanocellales archaeon]|nr:preprotein translocase subunit SecY [Methanocellales archaeon]MDD3291145.1 preprotein translocase subunit SecY [Methanocellales archaeon]MDD5235245.1 preprotein translocase subunit SecY [Methanocellales archaeon]MDD5484599.1 preprotein translocase subunit SecY [Methanocellales archaeon]